MTERRRRFWGWGYEDEVVDPGLWALVQAGLTEQLGLAGLEERPPPTVEEISLGAPRVSVPESLGVATTAEARARLSHAMGKSWRDLERAFQRSFPHPPDAVAYPTSEADVERVLAWASEARVAVIPYGGGTSVCGGVEPAVGEGFRGAVSLDLSRLDRVLEVEPRSRSARVQAGILGPALEASLKPHGLTLRHFPQSFELSSLGGWLATRAGGHFATLHTHIDDLVQGLRVVTPAGRIETRRLPGDGAGPAPERWFIGSEGALGVITEAWVRLFERPRFRASFTARFPRFEVGAEAVRRLAQSGLYPSNLRLLDPLEALLNGAGGGEAVLLVAFESHDHALEPWLARAAELCRDAGGAVEGRRCSASEEGAREGSAGAWRAAFLRAPYLRDALIAARLYVETFETAVTWDRFEELHAGVLSAARGAAQAAGGGPALVSCRVTHAYPDGSAPYFTVIAPAPRGAELTLHDAVKTAITEAMLAHGGTVTHHHAVGRDVRPFYARQVSPPFLGALQAVKGALDPAGVMNPGVLLPPPGAR